MTVDNKYEKNRNAVKDKPIVASFMIGLFGFFMISLLVDSIASLFFPGGNIDVHFLVIGSEKFLLVLWIIATVLLVEHNNLKSLGIAYTDVKTLLVHSIVLFCIITVAFFVIFIPGLIFSGDIGPGFSTTKSLISSPFFWFFILASAISEEIFFRAFLIMRLAWVSETKSVALLAVSLVYGILHYSLWGSVGALSFGVWGFIIGFYYAYVREDVVVTSIVHLFSDITIFLLGAMVLGLG